MEKLIDYPSWKFWFAGAVVCCVLLGSCRKGDVDKPVAFEALAHLNDCPINVFDDEDGDRYLVVRTPEQLEEYVIFGDGDGSQQNACTQLEEGLAVDFDKWTLLIGKKRTSHIQGEVIKQGVSTVGGDLVYRVRIKNGGYTAIGEVRFAVKVPKIAESKKVIFDIVVID